MNPVPLAKGVRLATLTLAFGLLAACSSSQPTPGGTAAPAPSRPLAITIESDPPHFNMGLTTDGSAQYVSRSMFEPLVNLSADFEVLPGLAESWSANGSSTEFTFTLRDGVTWHDGTAFTSKDVKFYFDEVLPLHPLSSDIAAAYLETRTPDDRTATVVLKSPYGPFFPAMTAHYLLPAHLYAGTDIPTNPANLNPVGTGPYKFDSFTNGDSVVVSRYADYWGEQGGAEQIVYKIMSDANARAVAFQSGQVDVALKLPIINMVQLQSDPKYQFEPAVMAEHLFLFFNARNDVLDDVAVRTALYRAVDREEIAEKVYHGTAEPSRSIMPNQVAWAIAPEVDYATQFAYDPAKAEQMLDAAGYPKKADGTRFSMRLSFRNSNPTWASTAELVKASYERIGVKVDLTSLETSVYGDTVFPKHDFDLTLLQLGAFADPTLGTARAYLCNPKDVAYRNPSGICDEALDAAFAGAASTSDQAQRVAHFTRAAQRNAELLGTAPLLSIKSMESFRADRWGGVKEFDSVEKWDWSKLVAK